MAIYFFTFHAQPRPDLEDADGIAGAYTNCWIEADNINQAEKIAKQEIGDLRWEILEKEDSFEITEDHYSKDSDGYDYYKQALIDKLVIVFHTYPIE